MKWDEVISLYPQTGRHKAQQEGQKAEIQRHQLNHNPDRTLSQNSPIYKCLKVRQNEENVVYGGIHNTVNFCKFSPMLVMKAAALASGILSHAL